MYFIAPIKPFASRPYGTYEFCLEDGRLSVWDDVADCFTFCHSIDARTIARLIETHTDELHAVRAEDGRWKVIDPAGYVWRSHESLDTAREAELMCADRPYMGAWSALPCQGAFGSTFDSGYRAGYYLARL